MTDLTFFTNEPNRTLVDRFNKILSNNTKSFDVLVGYFRTSGFYELYKSLENVEKIRVLVGLNVDRKTIELLNLSKNEVEMLSNKDTKKAFSLSIKDEMDNSEDNINVEQGVLKFIEFIKSGKLEMRIYPDEPIHAKVYIMRKDQDKCEDLGKVVTGSSNFSFNGLKGNMEFNVELKNSGDLQFALEKFEELWKKGIDISEEYVDTIKEKTWLKDDITPYELYLKFLYEYFYDEINDDKIQFKGEFLPEGFKKFQYQIDAVNQAKKILNKYNGVFLADVVGLGKTFIAALLARELKGGRILIICPPVLVSYWKKTMEDFDVSARVESLGKLDYIIEEYPDDYFRYVFVDEAHRFRNDGTVNYTQLHKICVDKKVVLISATPQNNYSSDIFNLIKLFQPKNNSSIVEEEPDLERFFSVLHNKEKVAKKLVKDNPTEENKSKLNEIIKENSAQIRDKVLRKIMVRRVRSEIVKYYTDDMNKQGLTFPKLGTPEQIIYEFDSKIDDIFDDLLELIDNISYSRYKTLTYLKNPTEEESSLLIGQMNLRGFMKNLLIKRLESSFYAFSKTVERFENSYKKFIDMFDTGEIYISKKYDVYDLLESDDDEKLLSLVEEGEITHYIKDEFEDKFFEDLQNDLEILNQINLKIKDIDIDPKLLSFVNQLKNNKNLIDSKKIIFTESKETAEYLKIELQKALKQPITVFTGSSHNSLKEVIRANYDPNYDPKKQKKDFDILITTDVLAEGINLHRASVLINYDLPWNPTRVMQRVGRINRVGTTFDTIYVYNFFPTSKSNEHLSLKDNIINKIQAFHNTFGEDSKFLSDEEEIESYSFSSGEDLYNALSKDLGIEEEEWNESELEYLKLIRAIRDKEEKLFSKIKNLPKKSRSARNVSINKESLISFIKDGEIKRIYISDESYIAKELTFSTAIKYLKCEKDEPKKPIIENFYNFLTCNKTFFEEQKSNKSLQAPVKKKAGNDAKMKKIIGAFDSFSSKFSGKEEEQLKKIKELFENGYLTKDVVKKITSSVEDEMKVNPSPHRLLDLAYEIIPDTYKKIQGTDNKKQLGNIEVILSEYLYMGD